MDLVSLATVPPGKYVLAVSGGVDSMVLLDDLARQRELELTVAHFDHGIREDSAVDRQLVGEAAAARNLAYIYEEARLGAGASEAVARQARYVFLQRVRQERGAGAIITAHHQDDVLETAILNLLRGTGRKGLSSLQSTPTIVRPLLNAPKETLAAYARTHDLRWREDSTNTDERYARNYVRQRIVPRLGAAGRAAMLEYIAHSQRLNVEIDALLGEYLDAFVSPLTLDRSRFIALPFAVSTEVLAAWLRRAGASFDKRLLVRLTVGVKTLAAGKRLDVDAAHTLHIQKNVVRLTSQ